MRYATKALLVQDIIGEHARLTALLDAIPLHTFKEPGVWGDDWSVHDLVAHLAEWQKLFLGWHAAGLAGETPDMPARGYKWSETPRLNHDLRERNRAEHPSHALREFSQSHDRTLALAESLSEAQLLEAGHFTWTGRNPLVTYLSANTASHYRFAQRVLRRWLRSRQAKGAS